MRPFSLNWRRSGTVHSPANLCLCWRHDHCKSFHLNVRPQAHCCSSELGSGRGDYDGWRTETPLHVVDHIFTLFRELSP